MDKQKTDYIVLSTGKQLSITALNVDNEKLAENSVKFFGVIFDSEINFNGSV